MNTYVLQRTVHDDGITVDHVTGFLRFGKPQGAKGMDNGADSSSVAHNVPLGRNVKARQS